MSEDLILIIGIICSVFFRDKHPIEQTPYRTTTIQNKHPENKLAIEQAHSRARNLQNKHLIEQSLYRTITLQNKHPIELKTDDGDYLKTLGLYKNASFQQTFPCGNYHPCVDSKTESASLEIHQRRDGTGSWPAQVFANLAFTLRQQSLTFFDDYRPPSVPAIMFSYFSRHIIEIIFIIIVSPIKYQYDFKRCQKPRCILHLDSQDQNSGKKSRICNSFIRDRNLSETGFRIPITCFLNPHQRPVWLSGQALVY